MLTCGVSIIRVFLMAIATLWCHRLKPLDYINSIVLVTSLCEVMYKNHLHLDISAYECEEYTRERLRIGLLKWMMTNVCSELNRLRAIRHVVILFCVSEL